MLNTCKDLNKSRVVCNKELRVINLQFDVAGVFHKFLRILQNLSEKYKRHGKNVVKMLNKQHKLKSTVLIMFLLL